MTSRVARPDASAELTIRPCVGILRLQENVASTVRGGKLWMVLLRGKGEIEKDG